VTPSRPFFSRSCRVGQIIAQVLSEQLVPFVALDVNSNAVQAGRAHDLPVYFGDAGSSVVLHAVKAERARCAVITLDSPGACRRRGRPGAAGGRRAQRRGALLPVQPRALAAAPWSPPPRSDIRTRH
jgi:hypothetical protein